MFRIGTLAPLALLALLLTLMPAQARDLSGTALIRERIALPPEAMVIIEAEGSDGSGAQLRQPTAGAQPPLAFSLTVPEGALRVRVSVSLDGARAWLSAPVEVPAGTQAVDLGEIVLTSAAALPLSSAMACGSEILQLGYADDTLRIRRGETSRVLPEAAAASGARFADGAGTEAVVLGDVTTVTWDGVALPPCRLIATPETRPFTARGNEPGWRLDADAQGLTFTTQAGEEVAAEGLPDARLTPEGRLVYAASGLLSVTLAGGPCRDNMTGMPHPVAVRVDWAGQAFSGCGGDPSDLLAGTWQVTEIDGAPVPGTLEVTMDFHDGRVAGQGGCNSYTGGFSLSGEGLSLAPTAATKMACGDPAMATETAFFAALSQVSRFDVDAASLTFFAGDQAVLRAQR